MFALACLAVLIFATVAMATIAGVFVAHRRAAAAADLAALAGAQALDCAPAAATAAANGARLESCQITGSTVTVVVSVTGPSLAGRTATLKARAMAGPDAAAGSV